MAGPSSILLSLFVTTTARDVRFLAKSQRRCVFFEESISYSDCERSVKKAAFRSNCGCLPWYYAPYHFEECPLSKYECISNTMNNLKVYYFKLNTTLSSLKF